MSDYDAPDGCLCRWEDITDLCDRARQILLTEVDAECPLHDSADQ